jgi:hypothetical protein
MFFEVDDSNRQAGTSVRHKRFDQRTPKPISDACRVPLNGLRCELDEPQINGAAE